MRFNCKNTIYDLANGGGKSLLMLLLMQNMIPNCTLDEKQPIERSFSEKEAATPAYTHLLSGSLIIMQLKMVSDI